MAYSFEYVSIMVQGPSFIEAPPQGYAARRALPSTVLLNLSTAIPTFQQEERLMIPFPYVAGFVHSTTLHLWHRRTSPVIPDGMYDESVDNLHPQSSPSVFYVDKRIQNTFGRVAQMHLVVVKRASSSSPKI